MQIMILTTDYHQIMPSFTTICLFLFLLTTTINATLYQEIDLLNMARAELMKSMSLAKAKLETSWPNQETNYAGSVWRDCVELYGESESRLAWLDLKESQIRNEDIVTWLSGVLANHRSCVDGLQERELVLDQSSAQFGHNFSRLVGEALTLYNGRNAKLRHNRIGGQRRTTPIKGAGLLATWNADSSRADFVVAQDGSGHYKTINEALSELAKKGLIKRGRVIIHVKSGVYNEIVQIKKDMKNVMFVGDGMERTIVTGSRNYVDGDSTINSATFGVFGDGFWARDMTFANTAGPHKHQAVALRVSSDLSVFYRCSMKGYQDTLLTHSLRQFYRDCHIYGTQDFIFGDAPAVFQNCDIFVRRPMGHQSNLITAQGRDNPDENTGISILNSRVRPAPELAPVITQFKTYLGRPWKKYSRTVFIETDLDGLIDPRGWSEWSGNFALSTLYYGEHMNSGVGGNTDRRVRWPGFHVIVDPREASPFSVQNFIQGDWWISVTGVPFDADI